MELYGNHRAISMPRIYIEAEDVYTSDADVFHTEIAWTIEVLQHKEERYPRLVTISLEEMGGPDAWDENETYAQLRLPTFFRDLAIAKKVDVSIWLYRQLLRQTAIKIV
jgi:hypothetical protein